jgi:hypothetical protein
LMSSKTALTSRVPSAYSIGRGLVMALLRPDAGRRGLFGHPIEDRQFGSSEIDSCFRS